MHLLIAMANLVLCSVIGWTCICRIAVMDGRNTRLLIRAGYSLLFMAASASGWSPWLFSEWPGWSDLLVNGALIVFMAGGTKAWDKGLPTFAHRNPEQPS